MTVFMLFRLTSTANGSRRRQGGVLRNPPSDCRRQALLRQTICWFGSGVNGGEVAANSMGRLLK